ncbi:MAG: sulfatase-like hydrolase/transferase [Planctomycetales bacterium]
MYRCLKLLVSLGFVLLAISPLPAAEGKRPNIVLIMADDLGFECLKSYGGSSYHTPHLDELAATGLRFEYCYASALFPFRVELMTGQYGFRTGWIDLIDSNAKRSPHLDPKFKTFGHLLKDAGYATAIAGKWQLAQFDQRPDHPRQCGFEQSSLWSWVYEGTQTGRYWKPHVHLNGKKIDTTEEQFGEDIFSEFLSDFIRSHKDRPFLAYYPMTLVHAPFPDCPELTGISRAHESDKKEMDQQRYAGMMTYMDHCVGKLIAAIDSAGLRENTVILFTGDNGSHHAWRSQRKGETVPGGKGQVTQLGARVPLIVNWKGVTKPGSVCKDLVDFSDVLPTLLELTGASAPVGVKLDGRSFAPQIRGEKGHPRDWVFTQLQHQKFIRDARWQLQEDGKLFDLQADELGRKETPVSGNPEAEAAIRKLQGILETLQPAGGKYPPAPIRQAARSRNNTRGGE